MNEATIPNNVTVISVCYNSSEVLPEMLSSIHQGVPIVLVDNDSADIKSISELAEKHNAKLVRNTDNMGFGVACNQGAKLAKTDFLLFLNPDARLYPDTLDKLLMATERYPDVVAMNPRVETGTDSKYFRPNSQLLGNAKRLPSRWPNADCEVETLTGSAFFVSRVDFEAVNGFDPNIFLFFDDEDLSYRLRTERGPIMLIHATLTRHLGGQSTKPTPKIAALRGFHLGLSQVYVMHKHGRPLIGIKCLTEAIVRLLSPVLLFSRLKRAKYWAFLLGVLRGLQIKT